MKGYQYSGTGSYWRVCSDLIKSLARREFLAPSRAIGRKLTVLHIGVADGSIADYLGSDSFEHFGIDPAPLPPHVKPFRLCDIDHFDFVIDDAFIGWKKQKIDLADYPVTTDCLIVHNGFSGSTTSISVKSLKIM